MLQFSQIKRQELNSCYHSCFSLDGRLKGLTPHPPYLEGWAQMNVLCISDSEGPVAKHFADNNWLIAERWQVRVVTSLPQWRMRGWCHCCRQSWSGTVLIFWGGSGFKPFAKEGVTIAEGVWWGKTELMTLHSSFPISYVRLTETQQCLLSQHGFRAVRRVRCGGHLCPEVKQKWKLRAEEGGQKGSWGFLDLVRGLVPVISNHSYGYRKWLEEGSNRLPGSCFKVQGF